MVRQNNQVESYKIRTFRKCIMYKECKSIHPKTSDISHTQKQKSENMQGLSDISHTQKQKSESMQGLSDISHTQKQKSENMQELSDISHTQKQKIVNNKIQS